MKKQSLIFAGVLFCLIGMLVMPVAALNSGGQNVAGDHRPIDPGLKDELWTIHVEHRLARYDLNVQTAGKVITALDSHGYDTAAITGILDDIQEKRTSLADALEAQNRAALKKINQELLSLWKEFRQEMRHLLKGA
jgi:hypothetical protein